MRDKTIKLLGSFHSRASREIDDANKVLDGKLRMMLQVKKEA